MKLLNRVKNILTSECPECGGKLKAEMFDMNINKMVYKCEKCNKEWI